jgi:hypothetical protein
MFNLKIPEKLVKYDSFFIKEGLEWIVNASKQKVQLLDDRINNEPHLPELEDLYFLYQLILLNNRTTILEYGSGWSTLIMHLALLKNKKKNKNKVFPRCGNPYELFCVDGSKKYLKITQKRIEKYLKSSQKIHFCYSPIKMSKFNGRYCTEYTKHPLLNPDLIYLDAPHQWVGINNKIDNFTTAHFSMMPMMCDILKFEHFLTPGTIIVTDGRTANARFLKTNFQRNWKHLHLKLNDQHYFYLDEEPLGIYNEEQIKFYNEN